MGTKDSKHINSEGNALFRSAVGDAQPIKNRDRNQSAAPAPRRKRIQPQNDRDHLTDARVDQTAAAGTASGEKLLFQRSSVSRNVMRDLRRGKYPVREEIDLHGMTSIEALNALHDFIGYCYSKRLQCVRVVHGKGRGSGNRGPVLKSGVNCWLPQWEEVLAYCSAQDRDGGTGAVYVLLKNH